METNEPKTVNITFLSDGQIPGLGEYEKGDKRDVWLGTARLLVKRKVAAFTEPAAQKKKEKAKGKES